MPTLRRAPLILGLLLISVALVVPAVAAASTHPALATAASMSRVITVAPELAASAGIEADSAGNGKLFKSTCFANHEAMDDPIVFPDKPGASHLHVFFGNTTTDAFSTYASLVGQPATCRIGGDHAAYWIPALYSDGTEILPRFANAYYLADGARGRIVPFPAGLKVIAGDSHATSPQSASILGWKCANQAIEMLSATPTACPANVDQVLVMRFPDCWNGRDLDSPDHKSHLAYRVRGVCPAGYPVALPRLSFNVHYRLNSLTGLSLASGSIYSVHADFFNAWNQAVLAALVARNLN
jgi:hypothetical protein